MLTESQRHHVRARKHRCPQQPGSLCPLEMSGRIRAICPLWGDAVSSCSGMAPGRPGACCGMGRWERRRATGRLRHTGSSRAGELSTVRTALKAVLAACVQTGLGCFCEAGRVSSENPCCVCVGLHPCPEERRSQFGEGEVLKQLQS